ncbi:MAG: hypothetical protein ABFS28_16780, partial [Bacteroidota bacterium]
TLDQVSQEMPEAIPPTVEPVQAVEPVTEFLPDTIPEIIHPLKTDTLDATESTGEESLIVENLSGTKAKWKGILVWFFIAVGAGFLFWLILWRRKKKNQEQ